MTQKRSPIICDGCKANITTTGNSVDYRLCLSSYSPDSWGGAVTDVNIVRVLKEPRHFCNSLECVRAWLDGPAAVKVRRLEREAKEKKWYA